MSIGRETESFQPRSRTPIVFRVCGIFEDLEDGPYSATAGRLTPAFLGYKPVKDERSDFTQFRGKPRSKRAGGSLQVSIRASRSRSQPFPCLTEGGCEVNFAKLTCSAKVNFAELTLFANLG